jgi:hypothetical protein
MQPPSLTGYWDHELISRASPATDWIWPGYLAAGNVTLLTGLWKAGKTTLLSLLLHRRAHGGTLAGLPVKQGRTAIISEEHPSLWAERARRLNYNGTVFVFPQPFLGAPTTDEWRVLLEKVIALSQDHQTDLLVIDALGPFLRAENSARSMFAALLPLSILTSRNFAVLANHHPARAVRAVGQAARGSGALLGHVDISMEMRYPGGDPMTRRRRLLALSRHKETPAQLLLELNAEATDYLVIADDHEDAFQTGWKALTMVFEDAPQKLTRQDILNEWPPDFDKPSATALRGWLDRAVDRALIAREGTGRRSDPLRYWLPAQEKKWAENPFYEIMEAQCRALNLPFESLTEHKRNLS